MARGEDAHLMDGPRAAGKAHAAKHGTRGLTSSGHLYRTRYVHEKININDANRYKKAKKNGTLRAIRAAAKAGLASSKHKMGPSAIAAQKKAVARVLKAKPKLAPKKTLTGKKIKPHNKGKAGGGGIGGGGG